FTGQQPIGGPKLDAFSHRAKRCRVSGRFEFQNSVNLIAHHWNLLETLGHALYTHTVFPRTAPSHQRCLSRVCVRPRPRRVNAERQRRTRISFSRSALRYSKVAIAFLLVLMLAPPVMGATLRVRGIAQFDAVRIRQGVQGYETTGVLHDDMN